MLILVLAFSALGVLAGIVTGHRLAAWLDNRKHR